MELKQAAHVFEALSSEIRLEIFRLLIRYAPDGLVAGEIAQHLSIPASNLSFHLKNLAQADLITQKQEGRFLRYKANIPLMLNLIRFLTQECCGGKSERWEEYRDHCDNLSAILEKGE
jgi:DNA-binding transcriptional ArsR family regulator